jgi:hypothetical protein
MLEAMATKNFTCTDNVFISDDLLDRCSQCTTLAESRPPKTDHMPVVWDLDFMLERKEIHQCLDWGDTDWDEFCTKLRDRLDARPYPEGIRDCVEFHEVLDMLQGVMNS